MPFAFFVLPHPLIIIVGRRNPPADPGLFKRFVEDRFRSEGNREEEGEDREERDEIHDVKREKDGDGVKKVQERRGCKP